MVRSLHSLYDGMSSLRKVFFLTPREKEDKKRKRNVSPSPPRGAFFSERGEIIFFLEHYVRAHKPLGPLENYIEYVGGKHHWHYSVSCGGKQYIVRLQNKNERTRWKELTLGEEAEVLKRLSRLSLAPVPYYYDDQRFFTPLLFLEHVKDGMPLNKIQKPLPLGVLRAAARGIAILNRMDIFPHEFRLRQRIAAGGGRDSFTKRVPLWWLRLARIEVSHDGGKEIVEWVQRLRRIVQRAIPTLEKFNGPLLGRESLFHFNGAHGGNIFWRAEKKQICFFDLADYVSFSRNAAFTAGRFLTSLYPDGRVPPEEKAQFARAYVSEWNVSDFPLLLEGTILERSIADLIYEFQKNAAHNIPIEENKNLLNRFSVVEDLIRA